ncbi:MAG: GGDEF domain-containing protein [Burkholderiales bacterium]
MMRTSPLRPDAPEPHDAPAATDAPAVATRRGGVHALPRPVSVAAPAISGELAHAGAPRRDALRRFVIGRPVWVTLPALFAASVLASVGMLFALTELMGMGYGPTFSRSIAIAVVAPILVTVPVGGFIIRLLREVDDARRQAQEMAWLDPLTGLMNRRRVVEIGAAELDPSRRRGGECAVALMDIDDFKRINDEFGHGAGDSVLQGVARTLCEASDGVDHVARWGGEEFVVLMPGASLEDALAQSERLRTAVEGLTVAAGQGRPVRCTVSIGLATAGHLDGFEQLVNSADRAMYRAKAAGKNRVAVG